jgi:hypothetical protein
MTAVGILHAKEIDNFKPSLKTGSAAKDQWLAPMAYDGLRKEGAQCDKPHLLKGGHTAPGIDT